MTAAPGPRPLVAVTRRLPDECHERLRSLFDVRLNDADEPYRPDDVAALIRGVDGVLATVTDRLDAAVLAAAPRRAAIVANFGVGFDHIDLEAARAAGIAVTNTPGVLTDDTADLTLALILAVARRLGEGERHLRAGAWTGWRPTHMLGTRVTGATIGIVGFGRIGRAVAARARHGFGMRVLVHSRTRPGAADLAPVGAEWCETVEDLLPRCDVVTLHCPATAATRGLLDAGRLRLMRPGAILVNTARGGLVDEEALAACLRDGPLAGAGLDVYAAEPAVGSTLRSCENAVLLPHLGSATRQARAAMGHRAIDNLAAFFAGEAPPDRIA